MRASWVLVVLLFTATAGAQSLRVISVKVQQADGFPAGIAFLCTQTYEPADCKADVLELRRALAAYPIARLGAWSFVLVPSDEWKRLKRQMGGDPASPAFTFIESRMTVVEQALFSSSAARKAELLRRFSVLGDGLLQLAVSHELGHALCREANESRADQYGRDLRDGQQLMCSRFAEQSASKRPLAPE